MSKKEFLHCTISDLQIRISEFAEKRKANIDYETRKIEYQSWLSGLYVRSAVSSVLSSKAHYPENPITQKQKKKLEVDSDVPQKTEEEIKQELRYYELLVKKANANIEAAINKGRQDQ